MLQKTTEPANDAQKQESEESLSPGDLFPALQKGPGTNNEDQSEASEDSSEGQESEESLSPVDLFPVLQNTTKVDNDEQCDESEESLSPGDLFPVLQSQNDTDNGDADNEESVNKAAQVEKASLLAAMDSNVRPVLKTKEWQSVRLTRKPVPKILPNHSKLPIHHKALIDPALKIDLERMIWRKRRLEAKEDEHEIAAAMRVLAGEQDFTHPLHKDDKADVTGRRSFVSVVTEDFKDGSETGIAMTTAVDHTAGSFDGPSTDDDEDNDVFDANSMSAPQPMGWMSFFHSPQQQRIRPRTRRRRTRRFLDLTDGKDDVTRHNDPLSLSQECDIAPNLPVVDKDASVSSLSSTVTTVDFSMHSRHGTQVTRPDGGPSMARRFIDLTRDVDEQSVSRSSRPNSGSRRQSLLIVAGRTMHSALSISDASTKSGRSGRARRRSILSQQTGISDEKSSGATTVTNPSGGDDDDHDDETKDDDQQTKGNDGEDNNESTVHDVSVGVSEMNPASVASDGDNTDENDADSDEEEAFTSDAWERADEAFMMEVQDMTKHLESKLERNGLESPFWSADEVRLIHASG